jgi:hypothetical protein
LEALIHACFCTLILAYFKGSLRDLPYAWWLGPARNSRADTQAAFGHRCPLRYYATGRSSFALTLRVVFLHNCLL